MLYASLNTGTCIGGHIGDINFRNNLRDESPKVTAIQADGDELHRACSILGRTLPPVRVYQFLGINPKKLRQIGRLNKMLKELGVLILLQINFQMVYLFSFSVIEVPYLEPLPEHISLSSRSHNVN